MSQLGINIDAELELDQPDQNNQTSPDATH